MTTKRTKLQDGTILFTGPANECERRVGEAFPLNAICTAGWWCIDAMVQGEAKSMPERAPGALEGVHVTGLIVTPEKPKPKRKRVSKSEQKRRKAQLGCDNAEPDDGSDD